MALHWYVDEYPHGTQLVARSNRGDARIFSHGPFLSKWEAEEEQALIERGRKGAA